MKLLAKNKRANYDYQIDKRLVAGVALTGSETKSIKAGHASLKGSFITVRNGELFVTNAHITPYAMAQDREADPLRNRKLLMRRREIDEIIQQKKDGWSVVPTALLLERNLIKVEIGVGHGKKSYDKRQTIKNRDTAKELARALKR